MITLSTEETGEKTKYSCPLCGHPLLTDGTYLWCSRISSLTFGSGKRDSCPFGVVSLVYKQAWEEQRIEVPVKINLRPRTVSKVLNLPKRRSLYEQIFRLVKQGGNYEEAVAMLKVEGLAEYDARLLVDYFWKYSKKFVDDSYLRNDK